MLDVDVRLERGGADLRYVFRTDATVTGVFGRSGAGKTTLIHLLAGLRKPTGGRIALGADVLFDAARRVDEPAHLRRIGVVFQDDRLFPHLSVPGNLRYGERRRAGVPAIPREEITALLRLDELRDRRVGQLSGGERQRVALGRALLSSPRLLLLDEPLSSVDRAHRNEILGLIETIRDRLAVPMLYVSHDPAELLRLTEHLLVVEDGRTVAHGPLREIARDTSTWRAIRALGMVNVLDLVVRGHDAEAGLTSLALAGAAAETPCLVGPLIDLPAGTRVHASLRPEDVALALARVPGISIRNQIPGRVIRISAHPDRALAEIDLGARVLVEISHRTVREMDLREGKAVWCLIKSNAVGYG